MSSVIVIQEWSSDDFHRRVMEMEAEGYTAKQETYRITPEVNPETGMITHLHRIEMWKGDPGDEK